jgi:rRNA-processing protein FCF1
MTTLTINFDTTTVNYISQKNFDISSYLTKLVKEDMLLNEIEESKKS